MHTCSLFLGILHSVAAFCTPTPDDDGWKIADYISLASAIFTLLGVLSAFAVAIAVPYFQNKHSAILAEEKERAEVCSFLQAIRAEASVAWKNYSRIRPNFQDVETGTNYIGANFLFSEKSFSIYDNAGVQVGRVSDVGLQESIVETYALAKSLIVTFHINNASIHELNGLRSLPLVSGAMPWERVEQIKQILAKLTSQAVNLKELDAALEKSVTDLLQRIDGYLAQCSRTKICIKA